MRRLTILKITSVLMLSIAAGITYPTTTHAASFDATNIIDDSIFYNNTSMTAQDIQNFLNSKVPVCDTNGAKYYQGVTRAAYSQSREKNTVFTCLKDYYENTNTHESNLNGAPIPTGAISAAQIIYNVAQQYVINPQTLIVIIQREQGLITDDWPWISPQYNSATGYGCPDTGAGCTSSYSGFYNQVSLAARQMRLYASRPNDYNYVVGPGNFVQWNPQQSCGGTSLNIQNQATASLYNYTPYQPNPAALASGYGTGDACSSYGNRNFWLYFNDWFGPTTGTLLLQAPSSPAVFLLSGSTRYGVPSYDTLVAYGLGKTKVTPVSDQFLNTLTDGGTLSTTFMQDGSSAVYVADNGYKFGFASYAQCVAWGYPGCLSTATKSISAPIFNNIHDGGSLKNLMLNGTGIYAMIAGQKWPFFSYKALQDRGYSSTDITPITSPLNSGQPIGYSIPEDNSYIKFGNNPVVYAYAGGNYYSINTYDILRSVISPGIPVYHDTDSLYAANPPQPIGPVPQFITTDGGSKTYMLGGGGKFDITGTVSDWPAATNIDELTTVLNKRPTSAVVTTNSTFQLPTGMLFQVKNNAVRQFYSVRDFFMLPYSKQPITISAENIATLSQSDPLISLGNGSLYKVTDQNSYDMIFTLNSDGSSCSLASLDQIGSFNLSSSNVQRLSITPQYRGPLQSIVKSSSGQYYVVSNRTKTLLSNTLISTWGVNTSSLCSFEDSFLSPFSNRSNAVTFARLPNGSIFYGNSGKAHQILAYSTFISLGGNSANTLDVPFDFLQNIPKGASL